MEAQAVRRDKPDSYARYMRANPLYFEGLWRVEFSEMNLQKAVSQKAVSVVFPVKSKGTRKPLETQESEPMAAVGIIRKAAKGHIKGTCENCDRGPFYLNNGICRTCERAAGSLVGKYRDEALAAIRNKIREGGVMPRGKNSSSKNRTACENCERDGIALNGRYCTTCSKAAAGLSGDERIAALAAIKEKIQSGNLKLWGKHKAGTKVEEKAPVGPKSGVMGTGSLREVTGKVEDRFDRLANMVKELEALGCEVTVSLSIGMGAR